jgi:diaminopimelate decarboxylase
MSDIASSPEIGLRQVAEDHMGRGGLFVYESSKLRSAAEEMMGLEMPFGSLVRYAAKANPHPEIIRLFDSMGLHFDAAHPDEAAALLDYGVDGSKISLSSSTLPMDVILERVIESGVQPVATSLDQIDKLDYLGCANIAVRVNPPQGSGHNNRTNTAGASAPFGIWHEQLPEALEAARRRGIVIDRLHTHIGSGADPNSWPMAIVSSLEIIEQLPDATTLDIGGGYKIARMPDETPTDMQWVGAVFKDALEEFADRTGREIALELEPGTHLTGNAGSLIGRVEEKKTTSEHKFLILNTGMNANLRPAIYGAQHDMETLNDAVEQERYLVFGAACESGDVLTPAEHDPEGLLPRLMKKAEVGDYVVIRGAGAYGLTMAAVDYCHLPKTTEIVV